jgi:hypothetical protein
MLPQFVSTVYLFALNSRWSEITRYFDLLGQILARPDTVLSPEDQERLNQIYATAVKGSGKLDEATK